VPARRQGRQRLVHFGSGSSSTAGDAERGGSASADLGESRGTCRRPAGHLPTKRVRDAPKQRDWPKRAKRIATPTSREFQARANGLDRAGSHTGRRWRHAVLHDRRARGRTYALGARSIPTKRARDIQVTGAGTSGA